MSGETNSRGLFDRLRAGYHGSAIRSAAAALSRGGRAVTRTAGRWIRGSWLFQWLTAEPDPEVIVIDLRETYTVGPFVRILDRIVPVVGAVVRGSITWRVASGVGRSVERRAASSPVLRRIGAALAPPEPPDRRAELDEKEE
ncbi:hypothetical protein [Halostella litorea]|uniref:hypothetical protein n=1 Tax=Halostella litorea TaxID=2528831 RepID=UPI0010921FEC|nr:hypothetical protein [Halostella litorea]